MYTKFPSAVVAVTHRSYLFFSIQMFLFLAVFVRSVETATLSSPHGVCVIPHDERNNRQMKCREMKEKCVRRYFKIPTNQMRACERWQCAFHVTVCD